MCCLNSVNYSRKGKSNKQVCYIQVGLRWTKARQTPLLPSLDIHLLQNLPPTRFHAPGEHILFSWVPLSPEPTVGHSRQGLQSATACTPSFLSEPQKVTPASLLWGGPCCPSSHLEICLKTEFQVPEGSRLGLFSIFPSVPGTQCSTNTGWTKDSLRFGAEPILRKYHATHLQKRQ